MYQPVILGLGSATSYGILRSLKHYNNQPIIADFSDIGVYYTSASTYAKASFSFEKTNIGKFLLKINRLSDGNAVIFPASDEALLWIDQHRGVLSKYSIILDSKKYRMRELINKDKMSVIAKRCGFDIPLSITINSEKYDRKQIKCIYLPSIFKPLNSIGTSKDDITIVTKWQDLYKTMDLYTSRFKSFQIQEFIEGDTTNMIEIFACRTNSGECIAPGMIKKIRQYPPNKGSSSYIKTCELNENLRYKIDNFLTYIDFLGIADFELKYCSKRKRYYFLEVNYRCGAPIYLSAVAGVNLPYLLLMSLEYKGQIGNRKWSNDIYWVNDATDWKFLLNREVGLIKYLKQISSCDSFAIFDREDIKPTLKNWGMKVLNRIELWKKYI